MTKASAENYASKVAQKSEWLSEDSGIWMKSVREILSRLAF